MMGDKKKKKKVSIFSTLLASSFVNDIMLGDLKTLINLNTRLYDLQKEVNWRAKELEDFLKNKGRVMKSNIKEYEMRLKSFSENIKQVEAARDLVEAS